MVKVLDYRLSTTDTMSDEPTRDRPKPTMKDISHTPPAGESVTNVWLRGRTNDSVVPAPDERERTDEPHASD